MFQMNENDVVGKTMDQFKKENYIADMMVRTLYSNEVTNKESCNIIKLLKEKVRGDGDI